MWDFKGCGVQRLQGKTLGSKIRTSEDPTKYIYIYRERERERVREREGLLFIFKILI